MWVSRKSKKISYYLNQKFLLFYRETLQNFWSLDSYFESISSWLIDLDNSPLTSKLLDKWYIKKDSDNKYSFTKEWMNSIDTYKRWQDINYTEFWTLYKLIPNHYSITYIELSILLYAKTWHDYWFKYAFKKDIFVALQKKGMISLNEDTPVLMFENKIPNYTITKYWMDFIDKLLVWYGWSALKKINLFVWDNLNHILWLIAIIISIFALIITIIKD